MTVLNAIVNGVDISFASGWADGRQAWGERVQLYRDYIDGKHRLKMTQEVADQLMIHKDDGERFTVNYSELVMQKLADRLKVTSINGSSDDLTAWADQLRKRTRFDGLQTDTHEEAIGVGDSFVMVDSASMVEGEYPDIVVEPAYNGETGIVPIYDLTQKHMVAVAKIWEHDERTIKKDGEGDGELLITEYRVNVYHPDRIEKFVTNDGDLKPFVDDDGKHVFAWVNPENNKPLGIPFVHFKHNGRSGKWNGESGIKSTMPLNDVLNRATMNITLIGELTGAQIRYIIGAEAPSKVTPGMWVEIMGDGVPDSVQMPKVGTFEIGSVTPIVNECEYLIEQISNVTDTPLPGTMGSSAASGESLKQREVGFTARVEKLQTKFGNNWEDVFDIAYRVQMALGTHGKPPEGADGWVTIWKPAEVRNDVEVVQNANAIVDNIDRRTYLDTIAPVYGWNKGRIDEILERQRQEVEEQLGAQLPPPITANSFAGTLGNVNTTLSPLAAAAAASGG